MNQCLEHDIPLMTYSFADMSAQQLELAVLRPFKFEKRMQEADHPHYPVARVFTLCLPGDEVPIDKDRHVLNSLFVVPGGRYILSSSNSGWIRCWDLGSEGIGSRPPSIMASYFVSKSAYIAVQRSHESSSVFTLLVIEAEGRMCVISYAFRTFATTADIKFCKERRPPIYRFLNLTLRSLVLFTYGAQRWFTSNP